MRKLDEERITFKKHASHLLPIVVFAFGLLFIILYDWANSLGNRLPILMIFVLLSSACLIHLYLHIEYYYMNKGVKLIHDKVKNTFRYIKGSQDIIITSSEINKIELNQSGSYMKKGSLLTTNNYRYHKFFLKDGRTVVVTSLLYPDFNIESMEHLVIKERIIASPLWS
jgi:hypothetical protein